MLSGLCCPFRGSTLGVVPFLKPTLDQIREDVARRREVNLIEVIHVDGSLEVHKDGPSTRPAGR